MRFWFLCGLLSTLWVSAFASAQSSVEETATLAGVVTGANVPAIVYLESLDDNPTRYYDGYQVDTQKDGSFSFVAIRPGRYRLRAGAFGYMAADASNTDETVITLHPRENRRGIAVALIQRPVLCGRVTENGKPRQTFMSVLRFDPKSGEISNTFPPDTEADGSFWLSDLDPGIYYLRAYMTWYPGSFSFNGAEPLVLGPQNGPVKCLPDIALQNTGCQGRAVAGRIADSSTNDDLQYRVGFMERNPHGGRIGTVIVNGLKTTYKAGESFTSSVCPGDYDVVLTDSQGTVTLDSQRVTVGDTSVDGVTLTPRATASIAGDVHFENIRRYDSCPGIGGQQVEMLREVDGQSQKATLDAKDHFEFPSVAAGDYTVHLGPFLREAVYVKSIVVDGQVIEERRFSVQQVKPINIQVTLSGDVANAAGHISADLRREPRWEVAWTRPKGSVSGKVLGDVAGGYKVKLRSARYNSNASGEYSVHTAADGSFQFGAVDPGLYTLRTESDGSLPYEYGASAAGLRGTPIVVTRGGHVDGLILKPPMLSSLCGRVTDSSGSVQSAIHVYVESFFDGYLHGRDNASDVVTDSNGQFRADKLLPGDYYLATPRADRALFFSSDGSLTSAQSVHLRAGESPGCSSEVPLALRLPSKLDETHTISGQVVGELPKKVGDRFSVSLVWDIPVSSGQAYAGFAKVDDQHRFHLDRVPNGRFLLQLHSAYGPEPMTWSGPYGPVSHLLATQPVEVRDGDVSDVRITQQSLPSVSGAVHFDHLPELWKNFDVSTQHITLVPREYRAPFSAMLAADGTFTIDPEDPGEYEVKVEYLRDPLTIRSIRLNGQEVKGRYFKLREAESAHLEVFVSGDSGKFTAEVKPDPSLPTPEPSVSESCGSRVKPAYMAVLLPDPLPFTEADLATWVEPRTFVAYSAGDADKPILQTNSLPPGHYRAVAAEHMSQSSWFHLPGQLTAEQRQMWSAVAALGVPVTVQPGEKVKIVLPDKTADVARLAARFHIPLDNGLLTQP